MSARATAGLDRARSNATPASLRAAIYCRVSTQGQAEDGYGLDGQLAECRALAERIGAMVAPDHVFQEIGSGADWELPRLLDLLDRAQRGEFDVLLALATSRLARDVGKLAVLQRTLKKAGVTTQYVHHRFDDNPTGQLTETMLAAIDVYERQNSSLRFTLGKRAKMARNLVMGGGPTAYGYRAIRNEKGSTVGLEVEPVAGSVVQRIFHELAHLPAQQVAVRLTADGVAPPGPSQRWLADTLRDIVANPVYEGRYGYGRRSWHRVTGPDGKTREVARWRDQSEVQYLDVPALVTKAEARAAQAAIVERRLRHSSRRSSGTEHPFTLRSLLTCGLCGGPLAVKWNNGYRYYICLRREAARAELQRCEICTLPAVPADGLEAEAWRIVRDILLSPEHLRAGLDKARKANRAAQRQVERLADLRAEIEVHQRALDKQIIELLKADAGSATEEALRRAGRELEGKLRVLKDALAELEDRSIPGVTDDDMATIERFAGRIQAGLSAANLDDRHQIYKLLRLRGTVNEDPEHGLQLRRKRFAIDWSAILDLSHESTRFTTRPGT